MMNLVQHSDGFKSYQKVMQDENLSIGARGMFSILMNYDELYSEKNYICRTDVIKCCGVSSGKYDKIRKELVDYGIFLIKNNANGRSNWYISTTKGVVNKPTYHYNITKVLNEYVVDIDLLDGDSYLYIMDNGFYRKIGITNNIKSRIIQVSCGSAFPIECKYLVKSTREYCRALEGILHCVFANERMNGEWFDLTVDEIITGINNNLIINKGGVIWL